MDVDRGELGSIASSKLQQGGTAETTTAPIITWMGLYGVRVRLRQLSLVVSAQDPSKSTSPTKANHRKGCKLRSRYSVIGRLSAPEPHSYQLDDMSGTVELGQATRRPSCSVINDKTPSSPLRRASSGLVSAAKGEMEGSLWPDVS